MKSREEIMKDILASAETNCVLKIKLRNVKNPLITAVDKALPDKVVLKSTCLYGYPVKRRMITLSEIESVTRYHAQFNHPVFVKMRYIKNHIADIRNTRTINPGTATA